MGAAGHPAKHRQAVDAVRSLPMRCRLGRQGACSTRHGGLYGVGTYLGSLQVFVRDPMQTLFLPSNTTTVVQTALSAFSIYLHISFYP